MPFSCGPCEVMNVSGYTKVLQEGVWPQDIDAAAEASQLLDVMFDMLSVAFSAFHDVSQVFQAVLGCFRPINMFLEDLN